MIGECPFTTTHELYIRTLVYLVDTIDTKDGIRFALVWIWSVSFFFFSKRRIPHTVICIGWICNGSVLSSCSPGFQRYMMLLACTQR